MMTERIATESTEKIRAKNSSVNSVANKNRILDKAAGKDVFFRKLSKIYITGYCDFGWHKGLPYFGTLSFIRQNEWDFHGNPAVKGRIKWPFVNRPRTVPARRELSTSFLSLHQITLLDSPLLGHELWQ